MKFQNLYDRWRFGFPRPGRLIRHPRLSYPFEQGGEFARRFESSFGDPSGKVVADLGCGQGDSHISSQILAVPWKRLVSVEAFGPYADLMRGRSCSAKSHTLIEDRIESVFQHVPKGTVDVALMVDVLEHFQRTDAILMLVKLEKWVNCGVMLFLPLGRVDQEAYDKNPLQEHLSTWSAQELSDYGYDVEVYEGMHGQLNPPADAGWAIKKLS